MAQARNSMAWMVLWSVGLLGGCGAAPVPSDQTSEAPVDDTAPSEETEVPGVCDFQGQSYTTSAGEARDLGCLGRIQAASEAGGWVGFGVDTLEVWAASRALAGKYADEPALQTHALADAACDAMIEGVSSVLNVDGQDDEEEHEDKPLGDGPMGDAQDGHMWEGEFGFRRCFSGESVTFDLRADMPEDGSPSLLVSLDVLSRATNRAQAILEDRPGLPSKAGCWMRVELQGDAEKDPNNILLAEIYAITHFHAPTVPTFEDADGGTLPAIHTGLNYRVEEDFTDLHARLVLADTSEGFEEAFDEAMDESYPVCVDALFESQYYSVAGMKLKGAALIDPPDEASLLALASFVQTYAEHTVPAGDALEDVLLEDLDGDGQVGTTGNVLDPLPEAADATSVREELAADALEQEPIFAFGAGGGDVVDLSEGGEAEGGWMVQAQRDETLLEDYMEYKAAYAGIDVSYDLSTALPCGEAHMRNTAAPTQSPDGYRGVGRLSMLNASLAQTKAIATSFSPCGDRE